MQGIVGGAVSAAGEPVAFGFTRGFGDRRGAAQHGEGGLVGQPVRFGAGDYDQLASGPMP